MPAPAPVTKATWSFNENNESMEGILSLFRKKQSNQ